MSVVECPLLSEQGAFCEYIETKKSTNDFTDKIDVAVKKARQNKEWRLE